MSYRCQKCEAVCTHSQILVVTKYRTKEYPDGQGGRAQRNEIAEQKRFCEACAKEMNVEIPALRQASSDFDETSNGVDGKQAYSVLLASA